mmetsp:Transcript_99045/g.171657  ORF Transcript_99045/g.171657 Transcript_99045/m.171657 type:complete len:586 (-) Transcript_99045:340-2097(-)
MDAQSDDSWTEFFQQVKARPPAFYKKCVNRLLEEDIYEPDDLQLLDVEAFAKKLEGAGATSGEVAFLSEAVKLAKGGATLKLSKLQNGSSNAAPEAPAAPAPAAAPAVRTLGASAAAATGAEDESDAIPRNRPTVVTIIVPGTEDPRTLIMRGGLEVTWNKMGARRQIRKFREKPIPHVVDTSLTLPTLYLHFLDEQFLPLGDNAKFDLALRSGNDNSEILIVLPAKFSTTKYGIGGELGESFERVRAFLKQQADAEVSAAGTRRGGFGPAVNFHLSATPGNLYFGLRTARPKASISLDKPSFGIKEEAELYLFAQNHVSVSYMSARDRAAFEMCISDLPSRLEEKDMELFSVFLKIFYEGGFAYNAKERVGGGGSYIPKNVGLAALGVMPSFEGQLGIATGYPYLLESQFLRFHDTVEVTIGPIREMSPRHGRYGLCFTRCVYIWEDEALENEDVLRFCSILPHGGFYYVPSSLQQYNRDGGFVYAFGEAREILEMPSLAKESAANGTGNERPRSGPKSRSPSPKEAVAQDHRVCTICLEESAVMATVPCGHRAYCANCTRLAQERRLPCPVCRGAVTSTLRVY